MLRNQLKIIIRTLFKQKMTTSIHVAGLALGLTCCFFIYLFIYHENSFDQYQAHPDRIYRINWITGDASGEEEGASVPNPTAEALRIDFPDLEQVARVLPYRGGVIRTGNQQQFKIKNILFAEAELLDLFQYESVQGNLSNTLTQPRQAAITQSMAKRLFGEGNPIGQIVNLNNKVDIEITSLIEETPKNTHLPATVMVSYATLGEGFLSYPTDSWTFSFGAETFVMVPPDYDLDRFDQNLTTFAGKHMAKLFEDDGETVDLRKQALNSIHFESSYGSGSPSTPIRPIYLWIFASIAIFVLAIAAFNFINLSTVQALKRANEVGVRKVLGAGRKHLIAQFLGEALLIALMAGVLAIAMTQLFLPTINQWLQQDIATSLFQSFNIWGAFIGLTLVVGLLSGLYPAIGLSRFQPARVLKSKNSTGNRRSLLLRRGLVVVQFTITLVLLIGTLVISRQVDYLKNKDLGFNKDAVLVVELPEQDQVEVLRNEWMKNQQIKKISFGIGAPISNSGFVTDIRPKGSSTDQEHHMNAKAVDINYLDTYELELVAGRWMNQDEEGRADNSLKREDRQYKFVVNEALVKKLGFAHPDEILGKEFTIGINKITTEVIGVVKDFNVSSLHKEIIPTVLFNLPQAYYSAGLKVASEDLPSTIAHIEKVWQEQFPNEYFEYHFLDEHIAQLYEKETRLFYLFRLFAGTAIFIGCLGLWGLINFVTEQRSKEISIRKVLGASISNIISLLSKDFMRMVLIAGLISIPLAWYLSSQWLQDFHYRIDTPWGTYLLGIVITIFTAFATMSVQSFKAALVNPAENLKNE